MQKFITKPSFLLERINGFMLKLLTEGDEKNMVGKMSQNSVIELLFIRLLFLPVILFRYLRTFVSCVYFHSGYPRGGRLARCS